MSSAKCGVRVSSLYSAFPLDSGQSSPLFAAFSNRLFVHDAIASRKQAKHVIVVKYLTLLEEAFAGDNTANENVSTVSA